MRDVTSHLVIAPILLPLIVGALMLLLDERQRWLKRWLSLGTTVILIGISVLLVRFVSGAELYGAPVPQVYLLGNWPAPFGIVLVADRLSSMMVLLTSVLGFCALYYALARWDKAGPRFHSLFLFLLMGLNGAFLTGDIFNLFVFFEVFLAASYGLALHGSGIARTRASLHYIAINVATSLLFLIGVALIYSVTGTLNMAHLATRVPDVGPDDIPLLEAGAAVLGIAFLVKAGMWPLCFWLPTTYAAAAPPVAAVFSILSKVGLYIILRLYSLAFGAGTGPAAGFANDWLTVAGLVTMGFGTIAILASRRLSYMAGCYVLVSSGILLTVVGSGSIAVQTGGIFYLVSSTLAVAALFLIIEPVERYASEAEEEEPDARDGPVFGDEYTDDPEEESEVGIVIPGTVALLGGGFIFCALLLAGLPPLSGFIAKFAILDGFFRNGIDATTWTLATLIILSGLSTLIVMTRSGIDLLWATGEKGEGHPPARINALEAVPVGILLAACLALMLLADPAMRYAGATARALSDNQAYISGVLNAIRAEPGTGTINGEPAP
ncbi:monovalent cation/H+ antiporter subunit D [Segnochrobactraceae bacterium EtOH-i3]